MISISVTRTETTCVELTGDEVSSLRAALDDTIGHLTPVRPVSTYDEDAGIWSTDSQSSPLAIHTSVLIVTMCQEILHAICARRGARTALGCITWTAQDGGAGTLAVTRAGAPYLQNVLGLVWQVCVCRVGRESLEGEARRRMADDPGRADAGLSPLPDQSEVQAYVEARTEEQRARARVVRELLREFS